MPQPSIPSMSVELKGYDKFLSELEKGFEIKTGVASIGKAAAYVFVWEYGNARQEQEGPKTTKGVNPDGEVVWLSIQAPSGFIAVSESQYQQILKDELSKVTFKGNTAKEIKKELEDASYRAMQRIAKIIAKNAPVDSGDLRDTIKPVKSGSALLDQEDDRILEIGV